MKLRLIVLPLVCGIVATALTVSHVSAQDCANAVSQSELNACAQSEYERADKRLNQTYAQVKARIGKRAVLKSKVINAQRTWIAFRDAECAVSAEGVSGGSAEPMVYASCLARMTEARTKTLSDMLTWLSDMLTCEEGDLSCATD
jgi:uncharacterized protein YecT (DUF1311 family)